MYQKKTSDMSKGCKNKQTCDVKISKETFGEECQGDIRFLKLSYSCSLYQIDENNQLIMTGSSSSNSSSSSSSSNGSSNSAQILSDRKFCFYF